MHTTVVYPDGTVTVTEFDEDEYAEVEVAADPVSDALDVLDEHFQNHGMARIALNCVRDIHNQDTWAAEANQSTEA